MPQISSFYYIWINFLKELLDKNLDLLYSDIHNFLGK